ncbi:MAG: GNAT family N-acetyltransferase [Hyphomicrobiaceae bacterium]
MASTVREAQEGDLPLLHEINAAATPGVGAVTPAELKALMDMSAATLVAEAEDRIAGFMLCLIEGCSYQSLNYRWISTRRAAFAYCDRIAVAADARGCGIGVRLYEAAFRLFAPTHTSLLCEVNLAPANPGSLRFHKRLGFQPIGERWSDNGQKGVVYLEKALARP